MAAFEYVAVDAGGKKVKGQIAADSARAARKLLRDRELTLLELTATTERPGVRAGAGEGGGAKAADAKIKAEDLVLVTRQLAMLVRAATPVEEALNVVAQSAERPATRRALLAVRSDVLEGARLSEAMARAKKAFDPLYRSMTAAGEASGRLGVVLERLADDLEQAQKMRRKVLAALVYPGMLALVAFTVVTALMVFVVPRVVEQFETLGQDLPLLTEIMIAVSAGLRSFGLYILGGVVLAGVLFANALKARPVKRAADAFVLALPVVGKAARGVEAARFARTLATLVGAGAPALDALAASRTTLQNAVLQDAIDKVVREVREGSAIAPALRRTGAFPPLLAHLAAAGERAGELDAMMAKGADYLESEFEATTSIALGLLEPLIIVVMGGIVTLIVLSIMLPILRLNTIALF